MVRVELLGLLGNNLFQYVVGRILAARFGLALELIDSPYKPRKNMPQFRALMEVFQDAPLRLQGRTVEKPVDRTAYLDHDGFDGFRFDLPGMLANEDRRGFAVKGYFERYEHFRPHKDAIRRWFRVDPLNAGHRVGSRDVVVHIRRGDFIAFGRAITLDYYTDILRRIDPGRVFVCGFGIDPDVKSALAPFAPVYVDGDPISDFRFMTGFNRIVQSQSTFSWWAGFLSQAEEIYAPLTVPGATSFDRRYPHIDLKVDDESRYHYVSDVAPMEREVGMGDLMRARRHLHLGDLAAFGRGLVERGKRHARRAMDLEVGYPAWLRDAAKWRAYRARRYSGSSYRFRRKPSGQGHVPGGHDRVLVARMNHSYAGFFACFTFALNQILFARRNNCLPVIDYGERSSDGPNAYFDADAGPNVWEYYFEPVASCGSEQLRQWIDDPTHPVTVDDVVELTDVDLWYLHLWEPASIYAYPYGRHVLKNRSDAAWAAKQRRRAHQVIRDHVYLRPEIHERVEAFSTEFMAGHHVIGAHVRGTDKGAALGAAHTRRKVAPESYFDLVDRRLDMHADAKLFVATDQVQYLESFRERYSERLICADCLRGTGDLAPFQLEQGSGYEKGAEVLVDALLLSRCDFLIKCSSHVGEAALWFNPDLPSVDVNELFSSC